MKFEFIHGNSMLYMTAETKKDKEIFEMLSKRDAEILGSNIHTPDQPNKWFGIIFPISSGRMRIDKDESNL